MKKVLILAAALALVFPALVRADGSSPTPLSGTTKAVTHHRHKKSAAGSSSVTAMRKTVSASASLKSTTETPTGAPISESATAKSAWWKFW